MNQDGADISLQDALDATNSQTIRQMKKPNIVDIPVGPVLPIHLPIQPVGAATPRLRHAFDVVGEVEFSHSKKEELNHYARDGAFQRFPEPFGFKTNPDVGVEKQLALIPNSARNKFYLLKHFIFKEQVKTEYAKQLCHGELHQVSWGVNAKNIKKALQYMFENMGGYQIRSYSLQTAAIAQSDTKGTFFSNLSEEGIDIGFDDREENGPRTPDANKQLRWIAKQQITEGSPVKDWPERLIKEALRNLMSDGVLALPVDEFPLTLVDVDPTVLNILEKFFPHFNEKALGMHGVPNVGGNSVGPHRCHGHVPLLDPQIEIGESPRVSRSLRI